MHDLGLPYPVSNTSSCFPVYWQQFTPPAPGLVQQVRGGVGRRVRPDRRRAGRGHLLHLQAARGLALRRQRAGAAQVPHLRAVPRLRRRQTFTGTGQDAQTESETDSYYQGMSDDNDSTAVTLTDSQGGSHDDTDQLAGDVAGDPPSTTSNGGPVDHSTDLLLLGVAGGGDPDPQRPADLTANAAGPVETWTRQAITDGGTTTWRDTETDTSYDASPSDADFGLPLFTYSSRRPVPALRSRPAPAPPTRAPNTSENLVGWPPRPRPTRSPAAAPPDGASAPTASQSTR